MLSWVNEWVRTTHAHAHASVHANAHRRRQVQLPLIAFLEAKFLADRLRATSSFPVLWIASNSASFMKMVTFPRVAPLPLFCDVLFYH